MHSDDLEKIDFKVIHVSSEVDEFPASELNSHNTQTKGWQSTRFAEFPQEIGLELLGGVSRIKQVQILAHQFKIPKKLELYIGNGNDYSTTKFKKLGHMSLDDNKQSNYKARELKTVYIDETGCYVKLILHSPHANKLNIHSQVSLIAVSIAGHEGGDGSGSLLSNNKKKAGGGNANNKRNSSNNSRFNVPNPLNDMVMDLHLDSFTAAKLRKLAEAKAKAIEIEDYYTAKQIKAVEVELKELGSRLAELEALKGRAVVEEDYDKATEIKDQMAELRKEIETKVRAIYIPGVEEDDGQDARSSNNRNNQNQRGRQQGGGNDSVREPSLVSNRRVVNIDEQAVGGGLGVYAGNIVDYSGSSSKDSHGKKIAKVEDVDHHHSPPSNRNNQQHNYEEEMDGNYDNNDSSDYSNYNNNQQQQYDPLDNRQIRPKANPLYNDLDPSGDGGSDANDVSYANNTDNNNQQQVPNFLPGEHPFEGIQAKEDLALPELLKPKDKDLTDILIPAIGEYRTRALFSSKSIPLREACLSKVKLMIENNEFGGDINSNKAHITAIMTVIRVGLDDKIVQIYMSAIGLLELLFNMLHKENISKLDIEPIVNILIDRLNDGQTKIFESAKKTLTNMLRSSGSIGASTIAAYGLRPLAAKYKNAFKPIKSRLDLLIETVTLYGMGSKSGVSVDNAMSFMKVTDCFAHSNKDVRLSAKNLCKAICTKITSTELLLPYLKDLQPKQLEDYKKELNIVDTAPALKQQVVDVEGGDNDGGDGQQQGSPGGGDNKIKQQSQKNSNSAKNNANDKKGGGAQQQNNQQSGGVGGKISQQQKGSKGAKQQQSGGGSDSESGNNNNKTTPRGKQQQKKNQQQHVNQTPADQQAQPQDFTTCMFCGFNNTNWVEDDLDMHYWKDCVMLAPCIGCNQVTDIAGLSGHIAEECECKDKFTIDNVTRLPIRKDEYENFKKSTYYNPPPSNCVYCPLCLSSLEDSAPSWHNHLKSICPKHDRNEVRKQEQQQQKSSSRPVTSSNSKLTNNDDSNTTDANRHSTGSRPGSSFNTNKDNSSATDTNSNSKSANSKQQQQVEDNYEDEDFVTSSMERK